MAERNTAETLALKAVAWLVGHEELLPVFLGSSGLSEDDLRTRLAEPELLGAVLDFVMMDDAWVMEFCDAHRIAYDKLMEARAALPGGEQVHWT
ncbi:MAG: DUF3572 domain-containing protein [Aliishimia sp.]